MVMGRRKADKNLQSSYQTAERIEQKQNHHLYQTTERIEQKHVVVCRIRTNPPAFR
jgi:hypothetical protein